MWKKVLLFTLIGLMVMLGVIVYLSKFHIDLSQEYRKVEDYENIVFKDSWTKECFNLCFWGLRKVESYPEFQDNRHYDKSSYEYLTLIEKTDVRVNDLKQVVLSPDKNYILYVESIYRGTGMTDDDKIERKER